MKNEQQQLKLFYENISEEQKLQLLNQHFLSTQTNTLVKSTPTVSSVGEAKLFESGNTVASNEQNARGDAANSGITKSLLVTNKTPMCHSNQHHNHHHHHPLDYVFSNLAVLANSNNSVSTTTVPMSTTSARLEYSNNNNSNVAAAVAGHWQSTSQLLSTLVNSKLSPVSSSSSISASSSSSSSSCCSSPNRVSTSPAITKN
jgi:hypothetical protein